MAWQKLGSVKLSGITGDKGKQSRYGGFLFLQDKKWWGGMRLDIKVGPIGEGRGDPAVP